MIDDKPSQLPFEDTSSVTRVLLVSPLPPPFGGIPTWTHTIKERGLPKPFEFAIVNTRVTRRHPSVPTRLSLIEIKRNLKILWEIYLALRSRRFSVIHCNYSLSTWGMYRNVLSTLLIRLFRVRHIVHLRGHFRPPLSNRPLSLLYRWAYRIIFNDAATILTQSVANCQAVLELGDYAYKTHPLPNFVNLRNLPKCTPNQEEQRQIKIIFTGALTEEKGVYTIIEIVRQFPGVRFHLVGDTGAEAREKLSRHIQAHSVANQVQVIGPVSHQEILALLAGNDIFLFPSKSRYEGFSHSVVEAMAVGLPVVASRVGAIPEMIDVPAGGYLVAPDDIAGYVKALTRLCNDRLRRQKMGQYNRRKVQKKYDYDKVIRQLCTIYAKITQRT